MFHAVTHHYCTSLYECLQQRVWHACSGQGQCLGLEGHDLQGQGHDLKGQSQWSVASGQGQGLTSLAYDRMDWYFRWCRNARNFVMTSKTSEYISRVTRGRSRREEVWGSTYFVVCFTVKIRICIPNFIEIIWFAAEIWRDNHFHGGGTPYWRFEACKLSRDLCLRVILLSRCHFCLNQTIWCQEIISNTVPAHDI